jgi:hypothetical protein
MKLEASIRKERLEALIFIAVFAGSALSWLILYGDWMHWGHWELYFSQFDSIPWARFSLVQAGVVAILGGSAHRNGDGQCKLRTPFESTLASVMISVLLIVEPPLSVNGITMCLWFVIVGASHYIGLRTLVTMSESPATIVVK